eukprot:INCI12603.1.p1 GENE.INCI12603.1~~INCI12603.1.p1  ORF type:complete len:526 (+),score=121.82 INCI12603.1:353-1930(+)
MIRQLIFGHCILTSLRRRSGKKCLTGSQSRQAWMFASIWKLAKKFAKLADGDSLAAEDPVSSGPVFNAPAIADVDSEAPLPVGGAEPSVVWGTDLDVEAADETPIPELVGDLTDTLKQLLLDLPEPEPELLEGLEARLTDEQMEEIYRRVWQKRQAEIREAFKHTRDDVKLIKRLLGVLVRGRPDQREATLAAGLNVSTVDEQLEALLDLEYIVSDIDHAGDFFFLGGLNVIGDALRFGRELPDDGDDEIHETDILTVRARAAWVLGTAVKNQWKLQSAVADSFVLPDVLDLILEAYPRGDTAAASKGIYCLGSLLRHNPPAQEQFLRLGGVEQLQTLLLEAVAMETIVSSTLDSVDSSCSSQLSAGQCRFIAKAVALVVDLVDNSAEETRPTHSALIAELQNEAVSWLTVGLHTLQCAQTADAIEKAIVTVDSLAALLAKATMDAKFVEIGDVAANQALEAAKARSDTFSAALMVVDQAEQRLTAIAEQDSADHDYVAEVLELAREVQNKLSPVPVSVDQMSPS